MPGPYGALGALVADQVGVRVTGVRHDGGGHGVVRTGATERDQLALQRRGFEARGTEQPGECQVDRLVTVRRCHDLDEGGAADGRVCGDIPDRREDLL